MTGESSIATKCATRAMRALILVGCGALCGCAGTAYTRVWDDPDPAFVSRFLDWQTNVCNLPLDARAEKLAQIRDRYYMWIDCDAVVADRLRVWRAPGGITFPL